jgi:hypothetical protein
MIGRTLRQKIEHVRLRSDRGMPNQSIRRTTESLDSAHTLQIATRPIPEMITVSRISQDEETGILLLAVKHLHQGGKKDESDPLTGTAGQYPLHHTPASPTAKTSEGIAIEEIDLPPRSVTTPPPVDDLPLLLAHIREVMTEWRRAIDVRHTPPRNPKSDLVIRLPTSLTHRHRDHGDLHHLTEGYIRPDPPSKGPTRLSADHRVVHPPLRGQSNHHIALILELRLRPAVGGQVCRPTTPSMRIRSQIMTDDLVIVGDIQTQGGTMTKTGTRVHPD